LCATAEARAPTVHELNGEPVTIAHRFTIASKVLGETRTYIVHQPPGYDFSSAAYPLVILLDGDANIAHVSATVDFLASAGRALPMIVVGIENTDRDRDLTPPITGPKPENLPAGDYGGADKFLSFIADELLPHLDRTYRTTPARILVGHSYGGLFAIHTLFHRPELFRAYIAASPSLGWDNQALAKQADQFVADHKDLHAAVFMTVASEGAQMLGGTQKVLGALTSSRSGTIQATFQHLTEESHSSTVLRSVYAGMEWLYEPYKIDRPARAYDEAGMAYFDKRFAALSNLFGYEIKIPLDMLMSIQWQLGQNKRLAEAQKVLQKTLQLYPDSANAHFDLGKSYLETGDKQQAEQEFRRTLDLYPGNTEARAALKKLGVNPGAIVVDSKPSAALLRSYAGNYRYVDEASQVTVEGGKLFITVQDDRHELHAKSDSDFYEMDADREYSFKTGAMTVHLPGFSYDSVKVGRR
jgi:predicted alpha/beta superfamily hydrolase